MDAVRKEAGEWEDQQPLGKRELDRILAGKLTRKERYKLYHALEECRLCIFEK